MQNENVITKAVPFITSPLEGEDARRAGEGVPHIISPSFVLRTFSPSRGEINRSVITSGFTLIELLVVVLIIGILAAVAVPQYQKAVMKSRFTSLMPMVDAIARAEEVYYLANGEYARDPRDLDVDFLPTDTITMRANNTPEFYYEGFSCKITIALDGVWCSGEKYGYYGRNFLHTDYPGQRICYVQLSREDAELRKKVCASLGGEPHDDIEDGWIYYFLP